MKSVNYVKLYGFLSASLIACAFFVLQANAASLSAASVRFDRLTVKTATTGTICARPATNRTETDVAVTFPDGYKVSSNTSNWSVSTADVDWPSGAVAWPGINQANRVAAQIVVFPSEELAVGTLYCFNWDTTGAVTTSSEPSNTNSGVITTFDSNGTSIDTGSYHAATITGNFPQLQVTSKASEKLEYNAEVKISEFFASNNKYEFLPAKFTIKVKNTGKKQISPLGNIFIKRNGVTVAKLEIKNSKEYILPGANGEFTAVWSKKTKQNTPSAENNDANRNLGNDFSQLFSQDFGKHEAELVLVFNDGVRDIPVLAETSFWIIPYRIIALVLVASLLSIGTIFIVFRGIKKRLNSNRKTSKNIHPADTKKDSKKQSIVPEEAVPAVDLPIEESVEKDEVTLSAEENTSTPEDKFTEFEKELDAMELETAQTQPPVVVPEKKKVKITPKFLDEE